MIENIAFISAWLFMSCLVPGGASAQGPTAAEKPAGSAPVSFAGLQNLKFSGLMQAWYLASNASVADTFRLRRTELKLTGDVTPKAKFVVMIDPAKALAVNTTYTTLEGDRVVVDASLNQAGRLLQDAFVSLTYLRGVEVQVGQFKVPLSFEGLASSAALGTVERALFASDRTRGGSYADVRDVGVMARGTVTAAGIDYQIGAFNGLGQNQNDLDKDNGKALVGRLVWRPSFLAGVQIGMAGAADKDRPSGIERRRLGLEWQWTRGPWTWRTELMSGRDGAVNRRGYYVHVGCRVLPSVEVVSRVDTWDPDTHHDTGSTSATERDYIAGVNYQMAGHNVKLQLEYLRKTFARGVVAPRHVLLSNMQLSW